MRLLKGCHTDKSKSYYYTKKIIRTLKIKNIIGEILKVNRQKAKKLNNITVEKLNKGNGEEGIKNKFSWAEKTLKHGC